MATQAGFSGTIEATKEAPFYDGSCVSVAWRSLRFLPSQGAPGPITWAL